MPLVPFTNTLAASYGLLVMHAMDMYRVNTTCLRPPPAPGLLAAGWRVVGYVTGEDALLPQGARGPIRLSGTPVCYGFLAGRNPGEFALAIRGTDGFVEWVEDVEFVPVPYAPVLAPPAGLPPLTVELGFWSIYGTMALISPQGAPLGRLATAVAAFVGAAGDLTVVGHSLGSALATYASLDLAREGMGARIKTCLFASPQPGNRAFGALFDNSVADYRLFNYVFDVVPRIPLGFGYESLSRQTLLKPSTAEASIRFSVACNHHVICYCAMLDYEGTKQATTPVPPGEADSAACIRGPEVGGLSIAKEFGNILGAIESI